MSDEDEGGKYLLGGLLVAVAPALAALLWLVLTELPGYDGYCSRMGFGGPRPPCSRGEYFAQLMLVGLLYLVFEWWWLLLLVLALPPAVGFLIGRRRPAEPSPR